jgi:hypothetical protein
VIRPRVFRSKYTLRWGVVYKPGSVDWFPTWREAFDRAYWWCRIQKAAIDAMGELS